MRLCGAWYGSANSSEAIGKAAFLANLYVSAILVLEITSIMIVWSLVQLREAEMSHFLKFVVRFFIAMTVVLVGTVVTTALIVLLFRALG